MNKVSVIVPVYNGGKYLNRCIDSLINQSYKNNEYIFINDGSTDDTLEILNNYAKKDNRIIVIDKKNTGVSDSRNIGIEKASGDYICFCDADDIYDKDYIKIMYDLIVKNNVSVVKCNFKVINKSNQIEKGKNFFTNIKLNNKDIINDVIPLCLGGEIPCYSCLLMIKKRKLNVKFPTGITMMEDVVFYINLLLNTDSMFITDKCLYTVIFNNEGATNNVKNYKSNILNVILVNEYIHNILNDNNLLKSKMLEKLNTNNLNAIADFIFNYYLYGNDAINFCKEIRTAELIYLIKNADLSKINWVRRTLLALIKNKHYFLLNIYFSLRKIVFNFKRR